MKAGRLPSPGITPTSSVLLAPPTSPLLGSDFGCPYTEPLRPSPAASEISRVTQQSFPLMPSRRPRKVHLFCSVCPNRSLRPSPPDHRVGTLNDKLRGSMGPWCYGLKVCDPSSVKVFSIRSAIESRLSTLDLRYRGVPKIPRAGLQQASFTASAAHGQPPVNWVQNVQTFKPFKTI